MSTDKSKRHDHRQSMWVLGLGGSWLWCYRCGAIRCNDGSRRGWTRPTGLNGENPAMSAVKRTQDGRDDSRKRRPVDDEAFDALDQDAP